MENRGRKRYKAGVFGTFGNSPKNSLRCEKIGVSHTFYAEFSGCCQGGDDKEVRSTASLREPMRLCLFLQVQ